MNTWVLFWHHISKTTGRNQVYLWNIRISLKITMNITAKSVQLMEKSRGIECNLLGPMDNYNGNFTLLFIILCWYLFYFDSRIYFTIDISMIHSNIVSNITVLVFTYTLKFNSTILFSLILGFIPRLIVLALYLFLVVFYDFFIRYLIQHLVLFVLFYIFSICYIFSKSPSDNIIH